MIAPPEQADDIFFHGSRLSPKVYFEDLREGIEVQFDVRPGDKGRQAFNVRLR
jgi:cold shock CspA family protein